MLEKIIKEIEEAGIVAPKVIGYYNRLLIPPGWEQE